MDAEELHYWLALKRVGGVGNVACHALVQAFGSPKEVFAAPVSNLRAIPGIGQKIAQEIKSFRQWPAVEQELERARKEQVAIITCREPLYPRSLLNIYDFPTVLYVKGVLRQEDINIAVVGSRMASAYGKFSTERLCRELAMKGVTIVSGLARGIDTAAHQGCLSAKGRTIAVLGCGLDIIYPRENKDLFEKIPGSGAIVTEFPFGTPPLGPNFPARNRIISGLSLGVVVGEANFRSGSLITARVALEQGREVFAVPGSIDAAGSKGTNKLIKEGAKLVENADDIMEEIMPQLERGMMLQVPKNTEQAKSGPCRPASEFKSRPREGLTDRESSLLKHLSSSPVQIDRIISGTGGRAGDILPTLLSLELKGYIRQLPGKMFLRKE